MSLFPLPEWSRIDVVCLDMDGTVLDLHFDNHFWQTHVPRRSDIRIPVSFSTFR